VASNESEGAFMPSRHTVLPPISLFLLCSLVSSLFPNIAKTSKVRIDSRSGKKIKMKVDKDATDVAMELGRAEMRAFFNSQF
jgi:hypothetical protein